MLGIREYLSSIRKWKECILVMHSFAFVKIVNLNVNLTDSYAIIRYSSYTMLFLCSQRQAEYWTDYRITHHLDSSFLIQKIGR